MCWRSVLSFNNPKLAQPDHLQLQPVFLLPIVLGLVVAFFVKSRSLTEAKAFLYLAVAGIALNVQLLTSFYIGWFFIFGSLLFLSLSLVFERSRVLILDALYFHRRTVAASAVVFLVGFIPFVLIYLPAVRSTSWYGLLPEYIPEMKSFLLMADGNYIWRSVTAAILARGSTQDWGRRIGVGLVPSIAWIVASILSIRQLAKEFRNSQSGTKRDITKVYWHDLGRTFLALLILSTNIFFVLGLRTPWRLVYGLVPGAKAIRAVARYVIVLALPMAVVFAFAVQYGIDQIVSRKDALARACLGVALCLIVTFGVFEQLNDGYEMYYSIPDENARIEKLASQLPRDCSVFYVAAATSTKEEEFEEQNAMHDAMLVSVRTHVPTLNGRSGQYPKGWSLRNIKATEYENRVQQWIRQNKISGKVCRLEIY